MRSLLFALLAFLFAPAALAQETTSDPVASTRGMADMSTLVLGALDEAGIDEAWIETVRGAKESVTTDVVIAFRTDAAGRVLEAEVVSATNMDDALQAQVEEVVSGLTLPDLERWEGTFTVSYAYTPPSRSDLVRRGLIAGAVVGVTSLLLALLGG